MSHNKITVAGQTPNSNGEITVNVEHLNDVNVTSPQANQVLQYNNGQWTNSNTSSLSGGTVLFIGDGSSVNYPTGGSTFANNVDIQFYNLVYNGVGATNVGSGWNTTITLPAGSYLCNAVVGITFSSSNGFASYRWYNHSAGGFVGTQGNVKQDTDTIGSSCSAYVTSSNSIILSVRLNVNPTSAQTLSAQSTRHAEYGYIEIRKLA